MRIINWDYRGWIDYNSVTDELELEYQDSWNQTLVSRINYITNFKPSYLIVPLKFKSIFESLLYYNKETGVLSDKYKIEFVNRGDTIYVNLNYKLMILNYNKN